MRNTIIDEKIKLLEKKILSLQQSIFKIPDSTRKGEGSSFKVIRGDTQEEIESIISNIGEASNEEGEGFILVQNNTPTYIEQLQFFKEFADVLEELNEFFKLDFTQVIPQNSPPPWGAQAKVISEKIKPLINNLKKALP